MVELDFYGDSLTDLKRKSKILKIRQEETVALRLGNITPELYFLEEHTVLLIRMLRIGCGLLVEQGAESLHSNLNTCTLNEIFKVFQTASHT